MAEKKPVSIVKLQIPAGQATPAPPIGPILSGAQVNIQQFCQEFNARTQDQHGDIIPVEISVYEDRSFTFITKTPPAAQLIMKELKIKGGSGVPQAEKVGEISQAQLEKIAEMKMADLNANDVEHAARIIAGTARSMGVVVEGMESSQPRKVAKKAGKKEASSAAPAAADSAEAEGGEEEKAE